MIPASLSARPPTTGTQPEALLIQQLRELSGEDLERIKVCIAALREWRARQAEQTHTQQSSSHLSNC